MRITGPLLVALLALTGTAVAAPGDPWVAYVTNSTASRAVLMRVDPATGGLVEISRNGPQGALFDHPYDLVGAPDGSLLVADMGRFATSAQRTPDGAIVRVDPVTGAQSLVSAGGRLVDPAGLALAPDGTIFVVENVGLGGDPEVLRIDPATGAQSVVTSGDKLCYPFGIAIEPAGTLVVTEYGDLFGGSEPIDCPQDLGAVLRVNPSTGEQTTLTAGAPFLRNPFGITAAPDSGLLVVNQTGGGAAVMRVNPVTGVQQAVSGNGVADAFQTPQRISLTPDGEPIVSDFELNDLEGGLVRVALPSGAQSILRQGDIFNNPLGVAVVANRPPAAALSASPPAVRAGAPVAFDASGSSDPEALRLRYAWDLDGNGSFESSTEGATASSSYPGSTTLTARVQVTDPHGASAVAAAAVTVDSIRPVIRAFRASRRGRRAFRFSYHLSEPASVAIAIQRPKRVRSRRCLRRPKAPGCVRWRTLSRLRQAGAAGTNTRRFSGKVRGRPLPAGRYRARATATDAVGNRAGARVVGLRVLATRAR